MAMGTRKQREKQEDIWIPHTELASAPGHPFYQRLNELLEAERFDEFVEGRCAKYYAAKYGRPSLTPGIYFRSLLIGYFEGIDSERGIAWRLADSLALRRFVGIGLDEYTPDHSTISRTRRLIDLGTHREVFGWVLNLLADRGLLKGQRVAIDATTLEANAAMRSIVRRDTGESYEDFLKGLAKASGIATPTREQLARLDRKRKKRMPNEEWRSPSDGDARIAKMKDGRTHLAHKAEHAVDLDTGAVVAVTLQGADQGDTTTLDVTLSEAGIAVAEQIGREAEQRPDDLPKVNVKGIEELVADKGYHSGAVVKRVKSDEVRSYIPEKQQKGRRHWQGKADEQRAVYQNRRRVRGEYGKSLLRRRGELVERSFAHCYETGGMRRTHLRGHQNILKRQTDPRGSVQPEPDPAPVTRSGNATGVEEPRWHASFAGLFPTHASARAKSGIPEPTFKLPREILCEAVESNTPLAVPKFSYLRHGLLGWSRRLPAFRMCDRQIAHCGATDDPGVPEGDTADLAACLGIVPCTSPLSSDCDGIFLAMAS